VTSALEAVVELPPSHLVEVAAEEVLLPQWQLALEAAAEEVLLQMPQQAAEEELELWH